MTAFGRPEEEEGEETGYAPEEGSYKVQPVFMGHLAFFGVIFWCIVVRWSWFNP